MRWLALLLVVLLVASAQAANHIPTPFPDGSDSIGIPDEPYAGTCFVRADAVPGQVVECTAAQRVVPDPTRTSIVLPIDCATHARHTTAEFPLPLPPGDWRIAGTGWCLMVQRMDTGALVAPACHAENYQMPGFRRFGPGDSECWYPSLPDGVDFTYLIAPPPAGNPLVRALRAVRLWPRAKPLTTTAPPRAPDGARPIRGPRASYRYRHAR